MPAGLSKAFSSYNLIANPRRGTHEPFEIGLDGHVSQDRRAGVLRLGDSTRVTIGKLPFVLTGELGRRGPHVRFALAADHITQRRVVESIPDAVLGPLRDVTVRGEFDYRLSLDLDLERPDAVEFTADVIPHGLALVPAGTRLKLFAILRVYILKIKLGPEFCHRLGRRRVRCQQHFRERGQAPVEISGCSFWPGANLMACRF